MSLVCSTSLYSWSKKRPCHCLNQSDAQLIPIITYPTIFSYTLISWRFFFHWVLIGSPRYFPLFWLVVDFGFGLDWWITLILVLQSSIWNLVKVEVWSFPISNWSIGCHILVSPQHTESPKNRIMYSTKKEFSKTPRVNF